MKAHFEINELKGSKMKRLDLITPIDTESLLSHNPYAIRPDYLSMTELISIPGLMKKPEPFIPEELPDSFKARTFINLAALSYKLEELPGNIVKYDEEKKEYKIVSLQRFIKSNKLPESNIIDDGLIYSSIINSGVSFNGSILIAGLKVDSKSIMEIIIQDVIMSIVPDAMILSKELEEAAKNIPEAERKNYFFIKGTTLTLVNSKKFKELKFDAKANNTYVTVEGKVFSSNDKFSKERLVSLDLISLDDILKIKK